MDDIRRRDSGKTLVEVVAVLALMLIVTSTAVPAVSDAARRGRLRSACRTLSGELRLLRTEAVLTRRSLGIVFEDDKDRYSVYRDGNGNGIRRRDIRRGIDRVVRERRPLSERFRGVAFKIAASPPIPEIPPRRRRLRNLDDPIKFGRSDIISCSPDGSCSSGTLYLSSGRKRMAAVRLRGWNAQVQIWEYDASGKWWIRRAAQ